MSRAQIGRELGISRERVRQILLKIGPDKAIEIIARTGVADAHKLGKELSLRKVTELVKSAIQD
jgi:DNA-binding transcriptional regulator LsrR (DeoR family)